MSRSSSSTSSSSKSEEDDTQAYINPENLRTLARDQEITPEYSKCYLAFDRVHNTDVKEIATLLTHYYEIPCKYYEEKFIATRLTDEEKAKKRKIYRDDYKTRPAVVQKYEKKKKDPTIIEQRKQYNKLPHVMKRKRFLARLRRDYFAEQAKTGCLKSFEEYKESRRDEFPPLPPRKKRKREKKEERNDDNVIMPKSIETVLNTPIVSPFDDELQKEEQERQNEEEEEEEEELKTSAKKPRKRARAI
jgi:hypothetical protein